jgi:AraC-like DNA-binding protein
VDVIWVGKANEVYLQANHHAALFTELIFNYGDQFKMDGQNIENFYSRYNHQIISGLKTSPFQTRVSGEYSNVGLLLKPFCYGALINKFGSQSMKIVSDILYENIIEPQEPRFEAVVPHLLRLFDGSFIDSDLLKFENYISSEMLQKGALSNFNLSLSITQKSFIQKFKKHYLLTPSQYVKLKQVNYAIQMLQNNKSEKLIQVGLGAGFYDQSHFNKVFKNFCGQSPREFINKGKVA